MSQNKSWILKLCLFATGLAGIVTEFILSTIASYLLGDSVFQWSLIISLMLFFMGVGSHLTKYIDDKLIDIFILTEYALSVFCAISAVSTYSIAAYTSMTNLFIYLFSSVIGLLIGVEIPLITRINQSYETLKDNIASVMTYDYLGALVGGLLFSFFALKKLGVAYTPIALGIINFSVAVLMLWEFKFFVAFKRSIGVLTLFVALTLAMLIVFIQPIMLYSEQRQYKDKIIYAEQSRYQKIVITQWKNHYWLFLNNNLQFSTYDERRYHEPLVHPAMNLAVSRKKALILGGGDGLALRELVKYPDVETITLVDIDPVMTELGKSFYAIVQANEGAYNDPRLKVVNMDAFQFLKTDEEIYDIVIVDLPDPNSIELTQLFTKNFYTAVYKRLARYGVIVTQSCDVLMATKAFLCINKTMEAAGFSVIPYHNYVPTMGDWGWNLGMKQDAITTDVLREKFQKLTFDSVQTSFLNQAAMVSMANFWKDAFALKESIQINTEINPALHQYYLEGYEMGLN